METCLVVNETKFIDTISINHINNEKPSNIYNYYIYSHERAVTKYKI